MDDDAPEAPEQLDRPPTPGGRSRPFGPRPPFRRRLAEAKLLDLGQGRRHDEVRRLRDLLAGHIDWGYGSAQRLPSDEEIARLFQASRNTVRVALQLLAGEGRLDRTVGVGTYTTWSQRRNRFDRLVDAVPPATAESPDGTRLLGFKVLTEIPNAFAGEFPADTDRLAVFERLTVRDGQPTSLRTYYLALAPGDVFERDDALLDLYDLIEHRFGHAGMTARRNFSAVAADESSADLLQVPLAAPLLFLDTYVRDRDGRLLMISHMRARSDLVNVTVVPTRPHEDESG